MFNKIVTALLLATTVAAIQLPMSSVALAEDSAKNEKSKRSTQLVGPAVGKKVQAAFELYSAEDIDGALVLLLDIDATKDYDKAYVDRFIAVMYATKGDNEDKAIQYLKLAIAPDILNEGDQGESIKLLADLQMQTKAYKEALSNYQKWMEFTGKEDGQTYVKMANAYYELGQLDKVIAPADKAIAAFGDKQNQNPYILKITSFYERKKYPEAIKTLETVVQLFPESKQWWTQLGMFYLLVENYDKGTQTLDLAYKQGFLVKESEIKTLANLYSQLGMPYKAAKLLEKNIESGVVKRDDSSLVALANAYHSAQNINNAAKYYGELAKMTNDAKYYLKQGMLLKQDEQFKPAIVALNKALELDANDPGRIYMSLAESHFYLEEYKAANIAIKKAIADPKTSKSARSWAAFIKDTADRKKVSI